MGNDFSFLPPERVHLRDSEMVTLSQQVANIALRAVRVDGSLLDQKLVNCFAVAKYNDTRGPEFKAENGTVFFGPFTKPKCQETA